MQTRYPNRFATTAVAEAAAATAAAAAAADELLVHLSVKLNIACW